MTLSAENIAVMRGARLAVDGASFALRKGELTAICGPNGAGKSSLLGALAGLLPTSRGLALLNEAWVGAIPIRERARAIGYLPQGGDPAWDISVATLAGLGRLPWAAIPGRPAHARRREDEAAVADALTAMQLTDFADRPVSQLSGGERARAMMARVLAGTPRWILADEPLASLDLAHQRALAAHLRDQARGGRGVVVVMHDLAVARNVADRVIVMDRGRIAADGLPGTALSPDIIASVWGVAGRWLGEPGAMALAVDAE